MKKLTVTAVRHKDIRDKEQLYIIMTNDEGEKAVINVGQKTFDTINEITKEKPIINETPKLELTNDQIADKITTMVNQKRIGKK